MNYLRTKKFGGNLPVNYPLEVQQTVNNASIINNRDTSAACITSGSLRLALNINDSNWARPFPFVHRPCLLFGDNPVGHYDTRHMRDDMNDDMNTQFVSKAGASISSYDPNFKFHQATFKAYKSENEDRTTALKTDYGFIVGVFDVTHSNSIDTGLLKNDGFRSL